MDEQWIVNQRGKHIEEYLSGDNVVAEVPDGAEVIGYGAFAGATVERIVLPDTVKQVDAGAFQYCRNLKEVVGLEKVDIVGKDIFEGSEQVDESTRQAGAERSCKPWYGDYTVIEDPVLSRGMDDAACGFIRTPVTASDRDGRNMRLVAVVEMPDDSTEIVWNGEFGGLTPDGTIVPFEPVRNFRYDEGSEKTDMPVSDRMAVDIESCICANRGKLLSAIFDKEYEGMRDTSISDAYGIDGACDLEGYDF